MLWSNNSSIHRAGTSAARPAASRACSSGIRPWATAAATRTSAAVCESSSGGLAAGILPFLLRSSLILSLLQSPIYPQLPHHLAAGVHVGSGAERVRPGPEPERLEHRAERERRRDRVAVRDLQRNAHSPLRQQRAIHPLG